MLDAASRLLHAIGARDYEAIASCFAPDATFRALTPHRLREAEGAAAIAERYRYWLEPLESFALVVCEAELVADRVRIRYRFRGRDPEHGWQENEHTAYATVRDGLIAGATLTCAGFRPAAEPR